MEALSRCYERFFLGFYKYYRRKARWHNFLHPFHKIPVPPLRSIWRRP